MTNLEQQIREALDALCGCGPDRVTSGAWTSIGQSNALGDCHICLPKRLAAMSRSYAAAAQCYMTPEDEDAAALRALKGEP